MNFLAFVIGSWSNNQVVVIILILIFSLFFARKYLEFNSDKIIKILLIIFFFIVARFTFILVSGLAYLKYSDKDSALAIGVFAFILVSILGLAAVLIKKTYLRLLLCCAVLFVKPCFSKFLYG